MSNKANRAAQFNPFDSLKGLQEALREKEEELSRVKKRELSEEQQEDLSKMLNRLERGLAVEITYYESGHYVNYKGIIIDINAPYRYVSINQKKIYFDDVSEIKLD